MKIFCDFDGTISVEDGTDYILSRLAHPQWEEIEDEWKRGLIGSAECMQRQIPLITATRQDLDATLDKIEIDASFPSFIHYCQSQGIPVIVLSDGVDYFIKRILSRHNLGHLPVIANRLTIHGLNGSTRYELSAPYSSASCTPASGVCKCRAIGATDGPLAFIGDGRSDFCVSNKPDYVFAKDKLADYCKDNAIAFYPYRQFHDITATLKSILTSDAKTVRSVSLSPAFA